MCDSVLGEFASYAVVLDDPTIRVHHIKAKEIAVEADPLQPVWLDGEFYGEMPVTLQSLPKAVNIEVP